MTKPQQRLGAEAATTHGRPPQPPIVPFDRDSLAWQVMADPRPWILFAPAAFALQGLHPTVAAAIFDHSTVFADPGVRALRSIDAVLRWVFGGQRALEEAQVLREIHKDIIGVDFDGERYHALQPEPFAWVWATTWLPLISGLRMFWHEPVTRALEEQAYDDMKNLGRIVGVHERHIPATIEDFEAYWDTMIAKVAQGHQGLADGITLFTRPPAPRFVPRLPWWPVSVVTGRSMLFLLAAGGPPEIRPLLEQSARYAWTPRRQRAAERLIAVLRLANPLPSRLRRLHEPVLVRLARRRQLLTTGPRPSITELTGQPAATVCPGGIPALEQRPGFAVLNNRTLRRRANSLRWGRHAGSRNSAKNSDS